MRFPSVLLFMAILISGMLSCDAPDSELSTINSPDGRNKVEVFVDHQGRFGYRFLRDGKAVLDSSRMAFDLHREQRLSGNLEVIFTESYSNESEWEQPWGEQRVIRDHHNGLMVGLQEKVAPFRAFSVEFRLFNDGLGFRYIFGEREDETGFRLMEEHTEFQLTEDPICWWQPGDWDIYEHLYTESRFSEIDALKYRKDNALAQSYIPTNAVNTPITMRLESGLHLSFHEAALTDFSGMTLKVLPEENKMVSHLVGSLRTPWKVERNYPLESPWRVVLVADEAKDLLSSTLILNLNEPSKMESTDWITPMLYSGIWWEMHLGTHSWSMENGNHGATTERAKARIDFCAENGIKGLLVEGWNTGWEGWLGGEEREGLFDFVTPYPDYDLEEVVRYARSKGVEMIMHHETSAAISTYEEQLDTAFSLMQSLGIRYVKTGYVGKILPKGEYHHGQFMVQHYRRVVEKAAEYGIALDVHEPIKATGIRRTWPNMLTREGLRGQEFNAWAPDGGNPPNHLPTVAFTRMLGGPVDYTPGIVKMDLSEFNRNVIRNTLAHQLAAYITIYSPLHMAPDLPEHYEEEPISLEFFKALPTDWETSIPLAGEVGEHLLIARKARGSDSWYIGGVNGNEEYSGLIDLVFIDSNKRYDLIMLMDAANTHFEENPTEHVYTSGQVERGNEIAVDMKVGGGFFAVLHPAK